MATCCPPAQYGPLCTYMCPITCRGPCHLETGHCSLGCLDGWMGEKCEQECNDMFYGKDCLQQCSTNCFDPKCNHLTGICMGGCNDGWQGPNCTQGVNHPMDCVLTQPPVKLVTNTGNTAIKVYKMFN
ncbi:scavenger receptor class F member 2-like [Mytilus californianus]|uniref:scavenger receptor class F member 2-like n=1 Tax=Mytilus californianus TaxID=6549 RepID=UPI0022478060|nr:scavenger receptor class F member 2-like [Mytilus californianus]